MRISFRSEFYTSTEFHSDDQHYARPDRRLATRRPESCSGMYFYKARTFAQVRLDWMDGILIKLKVYSRVSLSLSFVWATTHTISFNNTDWRPGQARYLTHSWIGHILRARPGQSVERAAHMHMDYFYSRQIIITIIIVVGRHYHTLLLFCHRSQYVVWFRMGNPMMTTPHCGGGVRVVKRNYIFAKHQPLPGMPHILGKG